MKYNKDKLNALSSLSEISHLQMCDKKL